MLVLYSTLGCHLCDQAMLLIEQVVSESIPIEVIDISDDDELVDTYGVRIPVVKHRLTRAELGWPFTGREFRVWLDKQVV